MHRFLFALACLLSPLMIADTLGAWNQSSSLPTVTDFNKLLEPGRHLISFRPGEQERQFVFVTPKNFKGGGDALPLVFFFHGAGGTAEQAARIYGWTEKADAEHFFAVFPQGLPVHPKAPASFLLNPHIWRDERTDLLVNNVDDVHFFEELLNKLEAVLPIDTHRVYVTGFSNGAGLTFTLGAHFSNRIAAIAPVSSQSFIHIDSLARPLPVYYLVGTADPLVLYHGGTSTLPWGNTRTLPPIQESVDTWVRLDGCPHQPKIMSDQNGVRVLRYGPGKSDSEVFFTTVEGNGHHWPGTVELLPHAICGPTLDPFHATDAIWAFFKNHPMPESD